MLSAGENHAFNDCSNGIRENVHKQRIFGWRAESKKTSFWKRISYGIHSIYLLDTWQRTEPNSPWSTMSIEWKYWITFASPSICNRLNNIRPDSHQTYNLYCFHGAGNWTLSPFLHWQVIPTRVATDKPNTVFSVESFLYHQHRNNIMAVQDSACKYGLRQYLWNMNDRARCRKC